MSIMIARWLVLLVAVASLSACAARTGPDGMPLSEDERINRDVLRALADDEDIVMEDLSVETRDGVVVISGVQESLDQVREILRRASRVRGVNEVINRIRVIGGDR